MQAIIALPKIYLFISCGYESCLNGWAMAEDGNMLAMHVSSSESWAMHALGLCSDRKHDKYKQYYPNGYELEWIDNAYIITHAGLQAALILNQALKNNIEECGVKE